MLSTVTMPRLCHHRLTSDHHDVGDTLLHVLAVVDRRSPRHSDIRWTRYFPAMTQYEPRHRHTFEEPWNTPNLSVNNHPYPPPTGSYGSSSTVTLGPGALARRDISRTPSPTPSEAKELKTGAFDWETLGKWRFWIRKEWICKWSSPCSTIC